MKLQDFEFRIWDDENKALIYNTGSVVGLNPDVHEIELWTGLRDIDGEKIFEGDIVKFAEYDCFFRVIYKNATWNIVSKEKSLNLESLIVLMLEDKQLKLLEIIGNIHETKEFYMIYKE